MERLSGRVRALTGWRRYLLALVLGALAASALPPWSVLPALLVAFPGLLWLVDGVGRWRDAVVVGWVFGLGHYLLAFHWVGNAFLVDAERFAALMPFAVLGLAATMAIYPALALFVAWYLAPPGWRRLCALSVTWVAAEWLRGRLFTGFPWDPIGTVWIASEAVAQSFAFIGVYGVGLLTLLVALSPALVGRRRDLWTLAAAAGIVLLAFAIGQVRLAGPVPDAVADIKLRIVQPNIPQDQKWLKERRTANFERLLNLSILGGAKGITHVIWPETATPFFAAREPAALRLITRVVPKGGLLLTGAPRRNAPDQDLQLWNSLHAIDPTGAVVATYDKQHLVPFGEYLPFRHLLSHLGLDKLAAGTVDYTPGPGPELIRPGTLPPFQPLICYEAIFGHEIVDPRPAWLLNVTNDAWFGDGAGPEQHLALARIRSIELGLPMVRAANTGISAVIDAFGRVHRQLALGQAGIIDSELPGALPTPTLYSRTGDAFLLVSLLYLVFLLILRIRQRSSATV